MRGKQINIIETEEKIIVGAQSLNCVLLLATFWTITRQAPLSMEFSRQEYWSGLPFPPAGDFPDPGTEPLPPSSPTSQADSLPTETPGAPLN